MNSSLRHRADRRPAVIRSAPRPSRWRRSRTTFVLVEAAGLLFMGMAVSAALATVGAALTGFGHALVFPGFGTEAVRHAHGDLHSMSRPDERSGRTGPRPRCRPRRFPSRVLRPL